MKRNCGSYEMTGFSLLKGQDHTSILLLFIFINFETCQNWLYAYFGKIMDCQHGNIIINWNKMIAGKMTTIYWKRKVIHSIWIKAKVLRTMLLFHFRKNNSFINGPQLSRRNHKQDKGKKRNHIHHFQYANNWSIEKNPFQNFTWL